MQNLLKTTQAYRLLKTEGKEQGFSHAYLLLLNDTRNLKFALKTFAKLFFDCDEPNSPTKQRISDLIDKENFADCLFFPQSEKKLSVEDAEAIQEESTLNPVETDKKLFVLGDFADANPQTQNKLLKLLEEPPKNIYFLLGASVSFPVLTTVLSRTKKLEIQPFSPEQITNVLINEYKTVPEKELYGCAVAANGSVGEAQNMLDSGFYSELIQSAFALALTTKEKLPALVKQIGETKRQRELISFLRLIFRDALVLKTNVSEKPLLALEKENLIKVSRRFDEATLLYAQEAFSKAEKQLKFNAVFAQCIELCMANILENNKGERL